MVENRRTVLNTAVLEAELHRMIRSVKSAREFLIRLSKHYGVDLDVNMEGIKHWQASADIDGSLLCIVMRMAFGGVCGDVLYKPDQTLQRALQAFVWCWVRTAINTNKQQQLGGLTAAEMSIGAEAAGAPAVASRLGAVQSGSTMLRAAAPLALLASLPVAYFSNKMLRGRRRKSPVEESGPVTVIESEPFTIKRTSAGDISETETLIGNQDGETPVQIQQQRTIIDVTENEGNVEMDAISKFIVMESGPVTIKCTSRRNNGKIKTLEGNHAATFAVHQDGVWSLHMPALVFAFVKKHIHAGAFGNCYKRYDDVVRVWKIPGDLQNIQDYTSPADMVNFVGKYGGYSKYRIDTASGPAAWLSYNERNYLMISMGLFTTDFDRPTEVELCNIDTMIEELRKEELVAVLIEGHHAVKIQSVNGMYVRRIYDVAQYICDSDLIKSIIAKAVQTNAHGGETRDGKREVVKLCSAWLSSDYVKCLSGQ
jgi:hypothetical protein